MNQSFFMGAVGASQQMQRMAVQGNNIANVNTTGYKAEKGRFTALFYQQMAAIEQPSVPYGVGTRMLMTSTDHIQGGVADTGYPQDYMIEGDGFFAVVDMATGEVSFTRNGSFHAGEYYMNVTDANGQTSLQRVWALADSAGRLVLGRDRNIIIMDEDNMRAEQPVGIFDFPKYDGMLHLDATRFQRVDKNGDLEVGTGRLIQGKLERSNVDLAEEITKVIEAQRAYTMSLRMVQTTEEIEGTINGLRG